MTITALPAAPTPGDTPPQFNTKAFAMLAALANFITQTNATAVAVDADASAAAASAASAAASAAAAVASANAGKWVSGTTYAEGATVWSPTNYLTYRRKTAGGGTTDPVSDTTNWAQCVGTGDVTTANITTAYITKTQANSPYTVLAANLTGNYVHDNAGATGECIFQLPAGAVGRVFRGEVKAAQYFTLKAGTGATISFGGSATASAGYFRCNSIGGLIEARWDGSKWNVFNVVKYWRKDT